ncbi:reverse transcriptase domain-containing protein [Tanacetum coccineum]
MFTTRSLHETPFANRPSTFDILNYVISPAFVEANYKALESLLRDQRRQVRNEEFCLELEYSSEKYDEEIVRKNIVNGLNTASGKGGRIRKCSKQGWELVERESEGRRPLKCRVEGGGSHKVNLPHLLIAHLGRRFVYGLKTISLIEFLSSDLPTTYKGLMEKTYTWIELKEVATNGSPNDNKEGSNKFSKSFSGDHNKGKKKNQDRQVEEMRQRCPRYDLQRRSKSKEKEHKRHKSTGFTWMRKFMRGDLRALIPQAKPFHQISKGLFKDPTHWFLGGTFLANRRRTVFSSFESSKTVEGDKKIKESVLNILKDILICFDIEERIIVNDHYPKQTIEIRKQLPISFKRKLQELLRANEDVFEWTYADMTEIPRNITIDGKPFNTKLKLNEYKHIDQFKQKKRVLAPERNKAACKEFYELMKAGILQEVKYQTWVANPVMVKKSDGGTYSRGRQRQKVFFTGKGVFCYRKMPFGLKNVWAIYQRLADKAFSSQIGRNLEAYVEEMVIKRDTKSQRKADSIKSVSLKECHRSLPFFKALKSCTDKKTLKWSTKAEEAFRKMKDFMEILPTLTAPIKGEVLVMYLAASTESISVVSLAERENRQVPNYFVSRVLQRAELNYPELEKLILALVHAARRLQRYFQAHPIRVLPDKPIKKILARPKKPGRIAKWVIELGEHGIEFEGRNSVKGLILADFIIETPSVEEGKANAEKPLTKDRAPTLKAVWKLYTDRASSSNGSGACLRIVAGMETKDLAIFMDSQLTANQVKGLFEARQHMIKQYLEKMKEFLERFNTYMIEHVWYKPGASFKKCIKALAKCEACQIHSQVSRMPKQYMTSVTSAWPLSQWGIDIVGPLPMASGGMKFLVMAIDYFRRWVEAKPLKAVFGGYIPSLLPQIRHTPVFHFRIPPQSNGQVEVMNMEIVKGMERRLRRSHQG